MEQKMMVADFAALVGTTSKTIYQKIQNVKELPVNEQLKTVKEKIKGREITLILTNQAQIDYYKSLYGKDNVINSDYYEILTDNNSYKPVNESNEQVKTTNNNSFDSDMLDKLITLNNEYNDRLEQKMTELITVQKELATVKGQQFLLEDKAGREGLYLKEINDLKANNNRLKTVIYTLITIITIGLTALFTYSFMTINSQKTEEVQEVIEVPIEQPKPIQKKPVRN